MYSFEPKDLPQPKVHGFLLGGVSPRPIALVSTISIEGKLNLAPFSFFNAFGSNPPIIAFSPARRGTDGSLKDTLLNIEATGECVVNAVTYQITEQVNLASTEYPSDTDEFLKSGLTPIDSDLVRPKRVAESPYHLECKLLDIKRYGNGGGAANIVICEVIKFHVSEQIMNDGKIDPYRLDSVGRGGGSFWTHVNSFSLFELEKPETKQNLGYDLLPRTIRMSKVLTANNIARLALLTEIPSPEQIRNFIYKYKPIESDITRFLMKKEEKDLDMCLRIAIGSIKKESNYYELFDLTAQAYLEEGEVEKAMMISLYPYL